MTTEKELRALKGQRVMIRNKFGGHYVGTVGTIRASKRWGGRLKVYLSSMRVLNQRWSRPPKALRKTCLRVLSPGFYEVYSKVDTARDFFIDDIEIIEVNPSTYGKPYEYL